VKHIPGEERQRLLLAFDIDHGKFAWRYPQVSHGWSAGGTMTTAGGLVFFGDDSESLEAVDAQSGKPLWHFNTGQSIDASPMTYSVEGSQYVAIAAGSDIISFTLPGSNRPEDSGQGDSK
jgi:alcohol dehydrogenase (cytochrome c)